MFVPPTQMTAFLVNTIFSLCAQFPLRLVHAVGALLGRLTFALSPTYAARIRDNLHQSGLVNGNFNYALKKCAVEAGKAAAEILWVWKRSPAEVCNSVRHCEGWEHLTSARAREKGVVLLTPHWGCFEVLILYLGQRFAFSCLYTPAKQPWMEKIMRAGRERGMTKMVPAAISGVRTLLKTLKKGEIVLILPDQVPSNGDGEWANFFGKPAYTMTLSGRLAQSTEATVLLAATERLPHGRGYIIRIEPLDLDFTTPVPPQINLAMERIIARAPAQYLWSYNRYKTPKGAPPPP